MSKTQNYVIDSINHNPTMYKEFISIKDAVAEMRELMNIQCDTCLDTGFIEVDTDLGWYGSHDTRVQMCECRITECTQRDLDSAGWDDPQSDK
jgi:hypothetical protein